MRGTSVSVSMGPQPGGNGDHRLQPSDYLSRELTHLETLKVIYLVNKNWIQLEGKKHRPSSMSSAWDIASGTHSPYFVSVLKVASWSKRPAGSPATLSAFQEAGRKKGRD